MAASDHVTEPAPTSNPSASLPKPPTPDTEPSPPDTSLESMLRALPSSGLFSRYDGTPTSDTFPLYLPSRSDLWRRSTIPTEKTRCLIRALRAKPSGSRKRALDAVAPPAKRRRWSTLDRERKTACLRIALTAATADEVRDPVLRKLKKGWAADPKKKQLVNAEVRQAICRSLQRWSVTQLREYVEKAGMKVHGQAKHDLVNAVHQHLAPEKELV